MKTEKQRKEKGFVFIIVIALVLILFSFLLGFSINYKENYLFKTILIADSSLSEVSIDSQLAEQYYQEAGFAYENSDYNSVERNCRLARGYYSNEVQGYEKIKAELKATKIKDELIYLYIEILEEVIDATYNLFEACEHFESAARYYDVYYNTNVPYDDMSHDMGGGEMDMMNEKIMSHDEAIKRYNNLLEEFKIELESRL